MITDKKARKAVKSLKQYCEKNTTCAGCLFAQKDGGCLLCDKSIFAWKFDED